MSGDAKEQAIIAVVVFCLVRAMLFFIDWFKRRRFAAKLRNPNLTVSLSLPYSIEFTSTYDDLIQAYEARRTNRMSRANRWVLIVFGWGWFALAIVAWLKLFPSVRADKWWQPFLPLTLGTGILWYNVVKPFLRKRQIRMGNPASQKLHLDFLSDGIQIQAEGIGTFKRAWDELAGVIDAKNGLLIYFTDGIVNWLPRRVFPSDAVKAALCSFLLNQTLVAEESEEDAS